MRIYLTLILLLASHHFVVAQLPDSICGAPMDDPPGCLLDTNNIRGVTNVYTTNPIVSSFTGPGCNTIFSDAWVQFIPLCEEVNFLVKGLNCLPRLPTFGIDMTIVDENFEVVTGCYSFRIGGIANQNYFVGGLTPGKRYHLVIFTRQPGWNCQYAVFAEGLETFGLSNPGLHGVFSLGTGSRSKFWVENAGSGSTYNWTVESGLTIVSGQGTSKLVVDANSPGSYEICCDITDADGSVSTLCDTVVVSANGTVYQYEYAQYCKGSCYNWFGDCLDVDDTYYNDENGVLHVLELCKYPAPRVGIYGGPTISIPAAQVPGTITGFISRGTGNYDTRWLAGDGRPLPNGDNFSFEILISGTYCFEATDPITSCRDTACVDVRVTSPLPDPCGEAGDEPPGCAICGPVYIGDTEGYTPNLFPAGFCGSIENNQWLAFVAGSTTATVSITSWNCQNGDGVQLYMTDVNLVPVSTCFSSSGNNVPGQITANGLFPGEVYYIMIDGFAGDVCDIQINIVGGVTTGPPDEPGQIEAEFDENPCPGQVVCYEIRNVNGATNYNWRVNGDGDVVVGQGSNEVCVQWNSVGQAEVCVQPFNPCFVGEDTCIQIQIVEKGTLYLDTIFACSADFPITDNSYCVTQICIDTIPGPGTYCVLVANNVDCDSTVCYTFAPLQGAVTNLDTTICSGDCFTWYNYNICSGGAYTETISSSTGCDSVLNLSVNVIRPRALVANPPPFECTPGFTLEIDGSGSSVGQDISYSWSHGPTGSIVGPSDTSIITIENPGTYILEINQDLGAGVCTDRDTVVVMGTIETPLINCSSTINSITFTWDDVVGANDYNVEIDGVPQGLQDSTSFTITGLAPNQTVTIGVQANGILGCGTSAATLNCTAQNCPEVDVLIDTVPPICRQGNIPPFQLTYTTQGAMGGGTEEWLGPGVDINGLFDPGQANVGNNTINFIYTEGPCSFIASRRIRVSDPPDPSFDQDSIICITNTTIVSYEGDATANAQYDWDFDNGINRNNGTGDGPYELSWDAPGNYTISLMVTENNCPSGVFSKEILVEDTIQKPVLDCFGSNNAISFYWDSIPGATNYIVNVLDGASGQLAANTYNINGLMPNDSVTIELVARTASICGPKRDTLTCEAKPCPPVQLDLGTPPPTCLQPGIPDIDLNSQLQISGNTGNEIITWIGNGVDSNGIFSPSETGPGNFRVVVRAREDGCLFADTINVEVNQTPVARYFASPVLCFGDTLIVSFNGNAPSGSVYHWDFGSGTELTGNTNAGPYELVWDAPGTDSLSLWLESRGCVSDTVKSPLRIDEPLPDLSLSCTSTLDGITFDWEEVPGATNYFWNLLDTPSYATLTPDMTSLQIGNLNTEDSITITIRAVDSLSVCPPPTITLTCSTPPCPEISFIWEPIPPVCLYQDVEPIDVGANMQISGNLTVGSTTWSGAATDANGIFDPVSAGVGMHTLNIQFSEYSCMADTQVIITVNDLPLADAGQDGRISCYDTITTIGGNSNLNNPYSVVYDWTGGNVANTSMFITTAFGAGNYTLTATDTITGCISSDQVEVVQGGLPPELKASIREITCFGSNDGQIVIDTVLGGTPPFLYAFNGGPYTAQTVFANLGPGTYTMAVQDAEGCEDDLTFIINEPNELSVELVVFADEDPIPYGDSVLLQAIINYAPDLLGSVNWTPVDQFPDCDETNLANCLSFYVTPEGQTVYTIRVETLNGCSAGDQLQVNVVKNRGIYIPSAFSPTGRDGINDIFRIYGDPKIVAKVNSFLIFDRWGELVHEAYNFEPISEEHGWDGYFRGKKMNPAVFVYFAEVEYFDGQVELFKGDVTLK